MFQLDSSTKKFDTFMVMLLFFLFAATAFILILVGIKQYKLTADNMNENYEVRTASSYFTEKFRQYDTDLGISITEIDGTSALSFSEEIDDSLYTTYIYFYDGFVRELFVSDDSVYTLQSGQEIIELGDLQMQYSTNSIELTLTSTTGEQTTMYLSTKSSKYEE